MVAKSTQGAASSDEDAASPDEDAANLPSRAAMMGLEAQMGNLSFAEKWAMQGQWRKAAPLRRGSIASSGSSETKRLSRIALIRKRFDNVLGRLLGGKRPKSDKQKRDEEAERQRRRRANMTNEQLEEERRKDREAKRAKRGGMSAEELEEERRKNRDAKRLKRENLTDEERALMNAEAAEMMRRQREAESDEKKLERKTKDAKHHKDDRAGESAEAREQRLQQQRERDRQRDRERWLRRYQPKFGSNACRRRHPDFDCADAGAGHYPDYAYIGTLGKSAAGFPLLCPYCGAMLFQGEKSNECCAHGQVKVDLLPDAPNEIKLLLDEGNKTSVAVEFRKHFNFYDVMLSFASLSATIRLPAGRGRPVVMMNGQLSQQIGNLMPGEVGGRRPDPLFQQVYVLDDLVQALDTRARTSTRGQDRIAFNRQLVEALEELIRRLNPFARALQSLGQDLRRAIAGDETALPGGLQHFRLSILDKRIAPDQVFALFSDVDNEPPDPARNGLWIKAEGHDLQRIPIWNRNADWLLSPLMFPDGTQTYGRGILRHPDLASSEDSGSDDSGGELEDTAEHIASDSRHPQPNPPQAPPQEEEGPPVYPPTTEPAREPVVEPANFDEPDLEQINVDVPASMLNRRDELDRLQGDLAYANINLLRQLRDNPRMEMEALELDAYLSAMTLLRPRTTVVLSHYSAAHLHERASGRQGHVELTEQHLFGADLDDADMILFPRFGGTEQVQGAVSSIGHFTLGVFFPATGHLHHLDSLRFPSGSAAVYYNQVIAGLNAVMPTPISQQRFSITRFVQHPDELYPRQRDGYNCGFYVALYAEMVLQRGLDQLYIPNFGEAEMVPQRTRMLDWLLGVLTTEEGQNYPTYVPPPPSFPGPSNPAQPQPISSHTPYHTDARVERPARRSADDHDSSSSDPESEGGSESSEELAFDADRVERSLEVDRPLRKRGPDKYASRRDWLMYQMQRRGGVQKHNPLMSYGKGTQKYLCRQAWLVHLNEETHQKKVQNRPSFFRTLRREFIEHHRQQLIRRERNRNNPNAERLRIGRAFQPSKNMRQSKKNVHLNISRAMAIRKAANPKAGLFITFTFNCKCPELQECLQTANPADSPDLCCRLATQKFKQLMEHVVGKPGKKPGIFGDVKGWLWSLEYQKRGNKHWHLVLMFDRDKGPENPNTPFNIDQKVQSELVPEPEQGEADYDKKLAYCNLVKTLYVHDCERNENAACRVNQPEKKCRFGFPKRFQPTTTISERGGIVEYRRRSPADGGHFFTKRMQDGTEVVFDNRHVVSHNRTLTMLMGSHVCVEWITEYAIWFYLFKYGFKMDSTVSTALYIQDRNDPTLFHADEFNVIRELTFMGVFEATDRIRCEPWSGRSHDVMFLTVHREGEEPFFFRAGHEEPASRRATDANYRSKWDAYQLLCSTTPHARKFKFDQIEGHYTFHQTRNGRLYCQFERRRRPHRGGMHVGMIYPPSPNRPETFATYLLAIELFGVMSYKDLRSLNRRNDPDFDPSQPTVECATAVDACVRRGLMRNSSTWHGVMTEASAVIHNYRLLTRYFVMLLHFADLTSEAVTLYEAFKERMLRPRRRFGDFEAREQDLLRRIQRLLEEHNMTMADFNLPEPAADNRPLSERVEEDLIPPVLDSNGEPIEMTDAQRLARAEEIRASCNNGQQTFIREALARLELLENPRCASNKNMLLLEGDGGVGKTHVLNCLMELCNAKKIPVRASASTGIAASRLLNAVTAHSLFGIPVFEEPFSQRTDVPQSIIDLGSYRAEVLRRTKIFIIDEVGMVHTDDLYCVDVFLRMLKTHGRHYGNALVIFTGDVKQLMPIVKNADPLGDEQASKSFFFNPDGYRLCDRITLVENMRLGEGQEIFRQLQRKIGLDQLRHVKFPLDTSNPPQHTRYIAVPKNFARFDEHNFITEIFNQEVFDGDAMELTKRVILAPTNVIVDRLNREVIGMMPPTRQRHTYRSTNAPDHYNLADPESALFAADNLQNIQSPDIPPHELNLIVGMPVMCMKNLSVEEGICNGTVMVVDELGEHVVWCSVETRYGRRRYPVPPVRFAHKVGGLRFYRTQIALRYAFSATINRSQGGTYDRVGYHGCHPIWAHGMLYTAVSRVTRASGLTILCRPDLTYFSPQLNQTVATTRNVVHSRVSRLGGVMTGDATTGTLPAGQELDPLNEGEDDYTPEFLEYTPRTAARR